MRLTLRTMLAFLDNILEPEDAQDIGKKIEDSQYATGLMHRIRDVMRRLRLAAPSPAEGGPGLDPNTVAEYLDNTLPSDRVPDFEKVCLESDVQLAEVASCHQILTLVLGEPAEIDPASRQRMYQVPAEATDKPATPLAAAPAVAAPAAPVAEKPRALDGDQEAQLQKLREKPAIPEYLREPSHGRRLLPIAVAVLLFLGVGLLILNATGQFERNAWLGRQLAALRGNPEEPAETNKPAEKPKEPAAKPEAAKPEKAKPAEPEAKPAAETPKTPEAKPAAAESKEPAPAKPAAPKPDVKPQTPDKTPIKPAAAEKTPEKPAGPQVASVEPGAEPVPPQPLPNLKPAAEAKPAPDKAAVQLDERLGRFISDKEVLLQYEPEQKIWQRLPPQAAIPAKHALLALPSFRPVLALTDGVTLQLLGGTQVELEAADVTGVTGVKLPFGRLIARALGKPDARLRVQTGGRTGVVTFGDAESVIALEIKTVRVAGSNPELSPAAPAVDLYVTTGNVVWDEGVGHEPIRITAPAYLALDQEPRAAVAVQDMPKWISVDMTNTLDRRASGVLEQALQVDRPAGLGLKESADHRQREVRWLALRCLAYLGEFDAIVGALNDSAKRLDWPDYIEKLHEGIARGPEAAVAVRQSLERQFSKDTASLYRMLWGYTDKDLQSGEDRKLVDALDSELLIARVLGFWNLKEITSWGLYYQPEQTTAKRQQAVRSWRKRLDAGQIRIGSSAAVEPEDAASKAAKPVSPKTPGKKLPPGATPPLLPEDTPPLPREKTPMGK